MGILANITADLALKGLLKDSVAIGNTILDVYAQYEQPSTGLASDFIRIYYNGTPTSLTRPLGCMSGNLAVALYSKANVKDGTAKRKRMQAIVSQIEELVNEKENEGYFFELSSQPITPITVNSTTGYGLTTLNVEWRDI